jgi:hypothetical protein
LFGVRAGSQKRQLYNVLFLTLILAYFVKVMRWQSTAIFTGQMPDFPQLLPRLPSCCPASGYPVWFGLSFDPLAPAVSMPGATQ